MEGNYTADFSDIRSIFNYVNEFIKPIQKIQFQGGNQEYIDEITNRLKRFLRSKEYLDFEDQPNPTYDENLRRITFYLILNTECTFKYDLSQDQQIVHLLQNCPQLSRFLLLMCIWQLNLHKYFYECISYGPIWFVWQFLDQVPDTLKFAKPMEIINRIEPLVLAIYKNICRSDYVDMCSVEKKIIFRKFYDFTMELLRHFFTPDSEKFVNWSKGRLFNYAGWMLKNILQTICNSFEMNLKKPIHKLDKTYEIYLIMIEQNPIIKQEYTSSTMVYSEPVQEILHQINMALLNSLQLNLKNVNLDMFLEWAEIDVDDEFTLQRSVGELCYNLVELIEKYDCFKHDVVIQLKAISIKPAVFEDVVRQSIIGEILSKLDSIDLEPKIRETWLNEFISRGVFVYGNFECLETLEGNIEYMSIEQIKQLLKNLQYHQLENDIEDSCFLKIKDIIIRSIMKFKIPQILTIICYSIEISQSKMGIECEGDSFQKSLNEAFNRGNSFVERKDILLCLLQNPERFFQQLFDISIKTEKHLNDVVEFVTQLPKPIADTFIQRNLIELIEKKLPQLIANEKNLIPTLLVRLKQKYFDHTKQFYQPFYFKLMYEATLKKDTDIITILMSTLQMILHGNGCGGGYNNIDDCLEVAPPLLFMCAAILDHFRWDVITYSEKFELIVELCIDNILELNKKFLPMASPTDKQFIINKIDNLKPLTKYYFQKYSLHREESPINFDKFLFNENELTDEQIQERLLTHFVRCTKKECLWIAKNDNFHKYWFPIMITFCQVVGQTTIPNALNCLRFCGQSLMNIVKKILLPKVESLDQKEKLLNDCILLAKEYENHIIYDELFLNTHYIMTDIINSILSDDSQPVINDKIKESINELKDCEAKMLLMQKM